jgi:hypothetical protein
VLRLKTAKAGHLPPSVMWGTGNPKRWSELDVLLLEGFQLYEDSLCGGCGQPLGHTSELKYTMAFAVDSVSCGACQQLDNKNKTEPPPGVKRYVKNLMSDLWRRP